MRLDGEELRYKYVRIFLKEFRWIWILRLDVWKRKIKRECCRLLNDGLGLEGFLEIVLIFLFYYLGNWKLKREVIYKGYIVFILLCYFVFRFIVVFFIVFVIRNLNWGFLSIKVF